MPPFEKPERQLERANLIEVKFEVPRTVRDGAGCSYPGSRGPTFIVRGKNDPCAAFRAKNARTNNAIGHDAIIGSYETSRRNVSLFFTTQRECRLDRVKHGGSP